MKQNINKYLHELPNNEQQINEELAQGIVRRLSDSLFKFVFCKEERLPIFLDMVSAFIYPDGEKVFKEARFINNRERSPEKKQDKGGCFDARATLDGSIDVSVEAQIAFDPDYANRTFTNCICIHGEQLERMEQYGTVTPTIFIGVLGCTQFEDREPYRDSVSLRLENGELCSDSIRLIFLDLPKFLKKWKCQAINKNAG